MLSSSIIKEKFGAPWPNASHIKNWEQQWKIGSRTSEQQQQTEKAATSSAAHMAAKQQQEVMEEGEITTDEGSEIGNNETLAEQAKIVTLVHSRELLQEVICPWENVQLFIRHFADHSPLHNCLAIFRIDEKMNHGENLPTTGVYIDQIGEIKIDTVTFKHLGSFEFNSIRPYSAGPIGDEDFEKWLDMLIHAGEELPETAELFERKNKIMQWPFFQGLLCSEQQKIFDGGITAKKEFPDISPIILKGLGPICKMLKFGQSDAFNVLCGLCIQVDISQIRHSMMKLPPLMNSLKNLLIPITTVTFDAPKLYEIHSMKSYFTNILFHSKNGNGDVLCSFKLPQLKTQMSNEQLIQISLAIWAMNNIPMPTAEYIERKAVQLQQALLLSDKINLPGTVGGIYNTILPIGPPPLLLRNNYQQKDDQSNGGRWTLQKFGLEGRRLKWFWIPIPLNKPGAIPLNKLKFKKQHEKKRKMGRPNRSQRRAEMAKLLAADVVEANKENRKTTKHYSVRNQLDIVPSLQILHIDEPDYTGN